jgi:hypothetical protein
MMARKGQQSLLWCCSNASSPTRTRRSVAGTAGIATAAAALVGGSSASDSSRTASSSTTADISGAAHCRTLALAHPPSIRKPACAHEQWQQHRVLCNQRAARSQL